MKTATKPRMATQLRVPIDLHTAVVALAAGSNRSANAMYLELIERAVKVAEKEGAK